MNNTAKTPSGKANRSSEISSSNMSMNWVTVSLWTDARWASAKRGLISQVANPRLARLIATVCTLHKPRCCKMSDRRLDHALTVPGYLKEDCASRFSQDCRGTLSIARVP